MAYTYSKIASYTVGSGGVSSIDFIAIPQNYTDLVILLSARSTASFVSDDLYVQFNGSNANFNYRRLYSTGSNPVTTSSGSDGVVSAVNGANSTGSVFSNTTIYITNYTSSNNKSISSDTVIENNATRGDDAVYSTLWNNSAAITAIKLAGSANFAQYSTATLYGIKAEL